MIKVSASITNSRLSERETVFIIYKALWFIQKNSRPEIQRSSHLKYLRYQAIGGG